MHLLTSFDPILDQNTELIILGTMPGMLSLNQNEYYADPRNQFWQILYSVFDYKIESTYAQRIQFLKKHRIGLWDVLNHCNRKGSLDSNIKNEKPNDFDQLLKDYPNIKFIVFNGTKSQNLFKKHVKSSGNENIIFKQLPSTSPTPGRYVKILDKKIEEWKIIKNCIG